MANDLQTSSPVSLPAVDLRDPSSLLLLPPWLATQIASVSDLGKGRTILDPVTKAIVGQVATIPKSQMPNGAQRQAIAERIEDLEQAARPGPTNRIIAILGELVAEHATARMDEDTADIKIGAYRDAVEDLPAWSVREAVRRWRRGDVAGTDPRDLDFAPKPARLRRLAEGIAATASGQAIRLRRILIAEPEEAASDAVMAKNQERFADVLKMLAEPKPEHDDKAEREAENRARAERLSASETQRKTEGVGR